MDEKEAGKKRSLRNEKTQSKESFFQRLKNRGKKAEDKTGKR